MISAILIPKIILNSELLFKEVLSALEILIECIHNTIEVEELLVLKIKVSMILSKMPLLKYKNVLKNYKKLLI